MKLGKKPIIVFSWDDGCTGYHTIRNAWKKMLKKIDLPYIKMHSIRHSVASLLISAGVDVKAVQLTLGHHSAQFTLDVYTHRLKRSEIATSALDPSVFQKEEKAI